jgi:hypothetical protein
MSLLTALRDYLETQLASSDWASIKPKVYFLPENIEEGVVLLADPTGAHIYHEIPGYQKGRYQLVIRAKDYGRGEQMANDVAGLLTLLETEISGLVTVKYSRRRHEPLPYPRAKGGGVEYSVNFDFCAVLKP